MTCTPVPDGAGAGGNAPARRSRAEVGERVPPPLALGAKPELPSTDVVESLPLAGS
ncbi:MAG TPA: hypothetical protein VHA82_05385 [Ramlibacter sp.]|uniref:hypothetical protein n=1 Tax=Ramlibacter sp. TaxID=1917967 RepID=UPI002C944E0D|nr:hypothetical protein [Ramlibacter sp.]HVZ43223.1 hypothetical protein [Ramlibacter sp.]